MQAEKAAPNKNDFSNAFLVQVKLNRNPKGLLIANIIIRD